MTSLLLILLGVLSIFLIGFLVGLAAETSASIARGARQAAERRKLNELWCALQEQDSKDSRYPTDVRHLVPYAYAADYED